MKPRLVIDVNQRLLLALNKLAAEQSVKVGYKVTRSELVLNALYEKYPELKNEN